MTHTVLGYRIKKYFTATVLQPSPPGALSRRSVLACERFAQIEPSVAHLEVIDLRIVDLDR